MATEARDRIAARDRVAAQRRTVEAPSTIRDDSDDEMIVSFPEFVFKEFIAMVAMTVFLVMVSLFFQDFNRPWLGAQQAYAQKYGNDFPIQVQQLFPKVKVNNQFVVERCITCHVPDIAKVGPQEAAKRLGGNHPAVIDDTVFAKYG